MGVYTEQVTAKLNASKYVGVSYKESKEKWCVTRWSKKEKKNVCNGSYSNEETAAHASDTLARYLMANVEQKLRLNFPGDDTEVHAQQKRKRKRSEFEDSQDKN